MTALLHDQRWDFRGIPIRLVHQGNPETAGDRGTVLFYHGLGAEIAGQTKELHSLAQAGFLVLGVDAVGHGLRRWPDFEERFSTRRHGEQDTFLRVITETAEEIPGLLDELLDRGWARKGRLGLGGISMGGFLTYLAVTLEPRLNAVTPILGSPRWDSLVPESPHLNPGVFPPVAILSQNAGNDHSVPPGPARAFHSQLAPIYRQQGMEHRQRYVEWPNCEHFMPEHEWNLLWENVVRWYQEFLD